MRILILHAIENPSLARRATVNQTFCLLKYAPEHEYVLHSIYMPVTQSLKRQRFDAIILDTTFLCWRWARPRNETFDWLLDTFEFVARSDAVKVALPQDEYDHSEVLDDWLADWRIDLVCSVCFEHKNVFYRRTANQAEIFEGLTGYIDDADIAIMHRFSKPFAERSIDIGYRARHLPALFGRFGRMKSELGERVKAVRKRGYVLDISSRPADTFLGDQWLKFLGDCRFTLGCESGSSLLDPRGDVRLRIEEFMSQRPNASFEEIEAACFPGMDGIHQFSAISPRLFESTIAGSCQILVEGRYLDLLKPGEHYIPVAPDLSNVEGIFEWTADDKANKDRIQACRDVLLKNPQLTYRGFAADLLSKIVHRLQEKSGSRGSIPVSGASSCEDSETLHTKLLERIAADDEVAPEPVVDEDAARPHSICLLSLSCIPDDPRVRRQGDALFGAGWDIVAIGLPGARSERPPWMIYDGPTKSSQVLSNKFEAKRVAVRAKASRLYETVVSTGSRLLRRMRELFTRLRSSQLITRIILVTKLLSVRFRQKLALDIYWSREPIQQLYARAAGIRADVWVANDWSMLPLAARLASERGGVYVYDTHEFAVNEYNERLKWRIFQRPIVKAIETMFLPNARIISTVSDGIADEMQSLYRLKERPLVIRNTPSFEAIEFRPAEDTIRVLYHGIIAPVRGLEPLIESVKLWRQDVSLTIRGPADPAYLESLRKLIEGNEVSDRVNIVPPVPMVDLVREASAFDIGFFAMPRLSKQHEYVLPNKLFEYAMAGLALCVSDLPEISRSRATLRYGSAFQACEQGGNCQHD